MEISAEVFAITVNAIATCFAGFQVLQSRRQSKEEFDWRKKDRAISYSVFKNPKYREARKVISAALGSLAKSSSVIPIEEINAKKGENPELSAAMLLVISHWGRMSSEIELGLVDEEAAYLFHATAFGNVFVRLKAFIEERNEINPLGNPDFLIAGERWQKRRDSA